MPEESRWPLRRAAREVLGCLGWQRGSIAWAVAGGPCARQRRGRSAATASADVITGRRRLQAMLSRSQLPTCALAYTSALITSIPTKGWLPSTQASCPGGIVYDSPAAMDFSVPSIMRTVIRPETA